MCDFDEFEDFEDDGFMDDDQFEDELADEAIDELADGSDLDAEPEEPGDDAFTVRDAFFIGSIAGNAYEEGVEERKIRRMLQKKPKTEDDGDLPI